MARLTEEKIKQIQEEYAKDPVYSHIAKKCGTTAATVKKYVSGKTSPAKTKQTENPICLDNFNQEMLAKVIEPLPIEEIEIPDDFRSWTTLTTAERDFMALNYFSGKK